MTYYFITPDMFSEILFILVARIHIWEHCSNGRWRMSSSVVICRLSSSVTLHGGPAGGFTRAGQAMTPSILTLLQDFSALLHTIYYMFLSPPRPLVVKPSVLQRQQFGIPSHSVSSNHYLLAPSNVISKLIYLPSPASPFSHPATPAPPTRACLNLCAIQIL